MTKSAVRIDRLLLAAAVFPALLEAETAAEIMARVAANQDRAVEARRSFVYEQTVLTRMHRFNGRLAREEKSEFLVAPATGRFEKKLVRFAGKYEHEGRIVEYSQPHHEYKDTDIDGDVISDLTDDLTAEADSRDGIAQDLFPLTAERQAKYDFRLEGRETYRGSEVYRIRFQPRKGEGTAAWSGEALVDAREYQPVLVTTKLAHRVPIWARTVLGTDVKQLGFALGYRKFDDGVWFPVSYGGEFEVKAVFFYKRRISISLANANFRRTDVASVISYDETAK
jgi:hypothetical protein